MRKMLAIAVKDLLELTRDRGALLWVVAFPLIVSILFGSFFGGNGRDRHKNQAQRKCINKSGHSNIPKLNNIPKPNCSCAVCARMRLNTGPGGSLRKRRHSDRARGSDSSGSPPHSSPTTSATSR